MDYKDIMVLARAGFTAEQIGAMARQEMVTGDANQVAQVGTGKAVVLDAPIATEQATAPTQEPDKFDAIKAELAELRDAVRKTSYWTSMVQPQPQLTAEDALASIINPPGLYDANKSKEG